MTAKATKALEDFHTITPHLTVRGVDEAITYYCQAFGAAELYRNMAPDGKKIMHAELMLDSASLPRCTLDSGEILSPVVRPRKVKRLYVEDVDDMFQRAVDLGATVDMPVQDCFWGDRYGILTDPFGHRWSIATRIEDLSPRQLQKRASEFNVEYAASRAEPEKGANQ